MNFVHAHLWFFHFIGLALEAHIALALAVGPPLKERSLRGVLRYFTWLGWLELIVGIVLTALI